MTAAVVVAIVAVVPTCTPHPVGPARTYDDYRRKATTTIAAVESSVQTVALAAKAAADDRATGPFLSVLISGQEDAINGVAGTFGSIQPPGARADSLRSVVTGLIDDALADVTEARIAARRGDRDALAQLQHPLADDADALDRFATEHGA